MKKVLTPVVTLLCFFIALYVMSEVAVPVANFLTWWLLLKEDINAPITTIQALLIDVITHLTTWVSVAALFTFLKWWERKAMHYAYVAISETIALGLAVLLRFLLNYYWIIFIVLGVLAVGGLILYVVAELRNNKDDP